MDKITDYQQFTELQIQQWKKSPNLNALFSGLMSQGQKMEDAIFEVRDLTNLETAEGVNLDVLGKPWNITRDSRSDNDYRAAISEKHTEYYSGEPESIIAILKAVYGATYVCYTPEYPGKYRLFTDAAILQPTLYQYSMAGVMGLLSGYIVDQAGNFLVDAKGNNIMHVAEATSFLQGPILTGAGDFLVDFLTENIEHFTG